MTTPMRLLSSDGYRRLHELAQSDPDLFMVPQPEQLREQLEAASLLSPWADVTLPIAPKALEALNAVTESGPITDKENAPILRQALAHIPSHWVYDERLWATLNCFVLAPYVSQRWKFVYRSPARKSRRSKTKKEQKSSFVKDHWLNAGSKGRESNASARLWWLYEIAMRASEHTVLHDLPILLETLADNVALYHQLLRRPNLTANPRFAAAVIELTRDEIPDFGTLKHINAALMQLNTQAGSFLFDAKNTAEMKDWIRSVFPPKVHRGTRFC